MSWVTPLVTAMAVAIVGGVVVALVNRIMGRVADDLEEFKDDTQARFSELRRRQDVHDEFRSSFKAKGWEAMPESLATGPGLAVALTKIEAHLTAIDTKMDAYGTKLDSYGRRLTDHDRWERAQKWPGMYGDSDEHDGRGRHGDEGRHTHDEL